MLKIKDAVVISESDIQFVIQELKLLGHKKLADTLEKNIYLNSVTKKILNHISEGLQQTSYQFNSDFFSQKSYIKNFDLNNIEI